MILSIIIPNLNASKSLKLTLSSLSDSIKSFSTLQSELIECIFIDGFSVDDSLAIFSSFGLPNSSVYQLPPLASIQRCRKASKEPLVNIFVFLMLATFSFHPLSNLFTAFNSPAEKSIYTFAKINISTNNSYFTTLKPSVINSKRDAFWWHSSTIYKRDLHCNFLSIINLRLHATGTKCLDPISY